MKTMCVAAARARLGEGALWDSARGCVWWVDIKLATLHAHEISAGTNHVQMLDHRLTALGHAKDGGMVASGDPGIVRLAIAADFTATVTAILAEPDEPPGNRFNDGKVDPLGRFWTGTMDDSETRASGSLYRLDANGLARVRANLRVPNGPCFLADGTMLWTDTTQRIIHAVRLDADGNPLEQRLFAQFTADQGYPDGMVTDEDNHVWIAFWDGWCLRRLSPDGRIVREVPLPVQRPTCPAFGGPDLDQLYVTSATVGLTAAALIAQPYAGGLLKLDPGVRGLEPRRFAG
ncbi:MAG: SMP-30/gluconolactonase/LRE family protein [Pseudomonadota bacterium]